MKKIVILVIAFGAMKLNVEAQLLKKLKEKTEKVLEPKNTESNSNNSNTENRQSSPGKEENANNTKAPSAPPSNCNIVFTLENNEKFLYDETQIIVKNNTISHQFVTVNNRYEYFLIDNGKRSGPFKEAPLASSKADDENESASGNDDDNISMGNDNKDAAAIQYCKTINGKLFIVFNGKNFGPYDYVSKMILSPDKKQFFALVTIGGENAMTSKMGMGYCFMVNDAGLKQKAGNSGMSMPLKFSVSSGFKHCKTTLMDQKTQTILSITSTGKQEEGSMTDMYSGASNTSFVNDNGDIVTIPSQSPTQILVNGQEAASFKVPIKNKNRLFLMPDIKKSFYYENGKLYKADGTEENISGILFPKVLWVNNEMAVYYYTIYKNESGNKDVYLCKKIL
jgi:hypothetical protein